MARKISADATPKVTSAKGKARTAQEKQDAAAEALDLQVQDTQTAEEAAPEAKPARRRKTAAEGAVKTKTRTTRTRTKKSAENQDEAAPAEDEAQPAEKRKTTRTRTTTRKKAAAGAGKLPSIFFEQKDGNEEPLLLNAETVPAVTMEVDEMLSAQADTDEAQNTASAGNAPEEHAQAAEKPAEENSQDNEDATEAKCTADECATATHNGFASFSSLIKTLSHVAQEHPGFDSQSQEQPAAEAVQEAAAVAESESDISAADTASSPAGAEEAVAPAEEQPAASAGAMPQAPVASPAQPAFAAATMGTAPAMPVVITTGLAGEEIQLSELEYNVNEHVACDEMHAVHLGDPSSFTIHCQYGDGKVEKQVIGENTGALETRPSEPEYASKFFRSCRSVVSSSKISTPMPEEGYWVPCHPAHRSNHFAQYRPAPMPVMHSPEAPAVQPDTTGSMLAGAPYSALPATAAAAAAPVQGSAEGVAAEAGVLAAPQTEQGAQAGTTHNVLICWVGKVDISAALRHDNINPGPIRMLLEHEPTFDHVLLLTTLNQSVLDTLSAWLAPCLVGKTLDIQHTKVPDLSDHMLVCQATVEAVEGVIKHYGLADDGTGITFHLSPGSPVTHAILLLLSTIRYKGIRLMQTRLTGLGKAPDILTISIPDILNGPGISMTEIPEIEMPVADNAEPAPISSTPISQAVLQEQQEEDPAKYVPKGRFGHKYGSLATKAKGSALRGEDLLSRFKPTHRAQPAKTPHGRIQRPAPQQAAAQQEALPLELEIPVTPQEDNALRAPAGNIGKPSRISPTAMQPKEGEPPMISAALGSVYKKMQRVATMLLPILLLGESGCGKSRLASYIHEWSGRGGKFVSLDCAGLTDEMFICELFGHSGGHGQPREGAFRRARSGTLFLENVNLLTPTQQSMLLRILAPVGETKLTLPARPPFPACTVRVRIIASADASIADDIREGRFRTDLYYRLAGVSTTLPPVREYTYTERENLLRSFLVSLQQKLGQCWNFSGDAWQTLLDEKWPGNLREVTRILQQVCLLSDSSATITREDVLQQLRQGRFLNTVHSHAEPAGTAADSFEAQFVQTAQDQPFSPDAASFGPVIAGDDDMIDAPLDKEADTASAQHSEDFFELGSGQNLDKALEQARNSKILEAMERAKGSRNEAAALLGMTAGQLNYALQRIRKNEAAE